MTYVHSLLDHVPSAIAVVGENGTTRYRNRAFQDTFGSDAEEWLREAARTFRLGGFQRWRTLILPAIFPYLVTGMITATGGAWNASIVSEYVSFGGRKISTTGLGAVIAEAADNGNGRLPLAGTLVMALVVIATNRLVWRRLYRLAESRFRLE